jgi:hypothetical protein
VALQSGPTRLPPASLPLEPFLPCPTTSHGSNTNGSNGRAHRSSESTRTLRALGGAPPPPLPPVQSGRTSLPPVQSGRTSLPRAVQNGRAFPHAPPCPRKEAAARRPPSRGRALGAVRSSFATHKTILFYGADRGPGPPQGAAVRGHAALFLPRAARSRAPPPAPFPVLTGQVSFLPSY